MPESIETWFNNEFWPRYPKKVSKGDAVKAVTKLKPDEDLRKKIMLALEAQIRYRMDANSHGKWIPEWTHAGTWIRQQRWLDEIESHAELKEAAEVKQCKECDEDALRDELCPYHLSKKIDTAGHFKKLREECREKRYFKQPGESSGDFIKRMRTAFRESSAKFAQKFGGSDGQDPIPHKRSR